jgi:hypothetical protein
MAAIRGGYHSSRNIRNCSGAGPIMDTGEWGLIHRKYDASQWIYVKETRGFVMELDFPSGTACAKLSR